MSVLHFCTPIQHYREKSLIQIFQGVRDLSLHALRGQDGFAITSGNLFKYEFWHDLEDTVIIKNMTCFDMEF